jgi:pimeloyl-ACP methyl ester carboxylesterase
MQRRAVAVRQDSNNFRAAAAIRDAVAALPDDAFYPFSAEGWLDNGWVPSRQCISVPEFKRPDSLRLPMNPQYPDVPVLVIQGTRDLQTDLTGAYETAGRFPNVTVVVVVPGATHAVIVQSQCAVQAVVQFVATTTLPPANVCAAP